MPFLETVYLGNPLSAWLAAAGIAAAVLAALALTRAIVIRRLHALAARTDTMIDDAVADVLSGTRALFALVIALYAGSLVLAVPETGRRTAATVAAVALIVQGALWGTRIIGHGAKAYALQRGADDGAARTTSAALAFIGRVALWSIVLVLVLDNLGVDVTALVAGLGVGGIAVALAIQNILGDLFASLSIMIDKPFVIGDFIIIGDFMGSVEHVGLKTTRLRSLGGEQIVFSNADLLASRVRNYKRMNDRRAVFAVGVTYETPPERLRELPRILRECVEGRGGKVRFDRAHFKGFGAYALDFEVVYYVLSPDYNVYMDIQQEINFDIAERFAEQGIAFAYPTQSIRLVGASAEAARS